jgi:hypothetical protein
VSCYYFCERLGKECPRNLKERLRNLNCQCRDSDLLEPEFEQLRERECVHDSTPSTPTRYQML